MTNRRALEMTASGLMAFYALVTLAVGVKGGLQEQWVQMTLSFSMCAFLVFMGMMGIFSIRINACFRTLENRLSVDPFPYRKKGLSAGSGLWVLIGVGVLVLFLFALMAASRRDFLKFGLGLLGCAVASIVFICASWTMGCAWRIRRIEALISGKLGRGTDDR